MYRGLAGQPLGALSGLDGLPEPFFANFTQTLLFPAAGEYKLRVDFKDDIAKKSGTFETVFHVVGP